MPIEITRRTRGGERTFHVFTQAEADGLGMAFVPWREAVEGGFACR